MEFKNKKALIVANLNKEKAMEISNDVKKFLLRFAFDTDVLYTATEFFEAESKKEYDLILSIGGDGTLLSVVHKFYTSSTPIFAINAGDLGFITPFSFNDWKDGLKGFLDGKATIKNEFLLDAELYSENSELLFKEVALNDVSVQKSESSHLLLINAKSGDEHFAHGLAADGVVIATPIGSTAYSMSAGGSVILEGTNAFIFTPNAPFMAMDRGIVFPSSAVLSIELSEKQKAPRSSVDIDGRTCFKMQKKQTLVIKKANEIVRIVDNLSFSDTERIGEKMMWKPQGD